MRRRRAAASKLQATSYKLHFVGRPRAVEAVLRGQRRPQLLRHVRVAPLEVDHVERVGQSVEEQPPVTYNL